MVLGKLVRSMFGGGMGFEKARRVAGSNDRREIESFVNSVEKNSKVGLPAAESGLETMESLGCDAGHPECLQHE